MPEIFPIPPRAVKPHSQLRDVSDPEWHKRSCGVASLKMVVQFVQPDTVLPSLDVLIDEGVKQGAYLPSRGWDHRALAEFAEQYVCAATAYDWTALPPRTAFSYFLEDLARYPVIASVTKEFSPSEDGHLIVVTGIDAGNVWVNDPFRMTDEEMVYTVPLGHFEKCWTQRIIYITRPDEIHFPRFACRIE